MSQGLIRTLYNVPDLNGQVDTKFWVWVGLLVSLAIKTVCHTICFTGCTILVNNACPRVESLGAVNGFSQCKFFKVNRRYIFFCILNEYCIRLCKCYSRDWSRYLWCRLVRVSLTQKIEEKILLINLLLFLYMYSSLSATWIPYNIRVNITFAVLSLIGVVTWFLSKKLNPEELETAHAREEVVDIRQSSSSSSSRS